MKRWSVWKAPYDARCHMLMERDYVVLDDDKYPERIGLLTSDAASYEWLCHAYANAEWKMII